VSLTETLKRSPTDCSRTLVEPAPDASRLCAVVAVCALCVRCAVLGPCVGALVPRGRWTTPPATTMDMAAEKGCGYPGRRYGGSDFVFFGFVYSHSLLVLRSHIPRRVEYCKRVGVGVTVIAEQRHSKLTRQNSAVYLPGKP